MAGAILTNSARAQAKGVVGFAVASDGGRDGSSTAGATIRRLFSFFDRDPTVGARRVVYPGRKNPYIRLQLSTIFSYPLPAALGFDQDWNSESSKKLAEPYIRSASRAAPKSLIQGRRSFHDDRTNLLWRPAKAAPRVLTVTADLGHERV